MKLSLYGLMICLTMANLAHGMDPSSAKTPVVKTLNTSNTQMSQQVCMEVLRDLAEKRLGVKKKPNLNCEIHNS